MPLVLPVAFIQEQKATTQKIAAHCKSRICLNGRTCFRGHIHQDRNRVGKDQEEDQNAQDRLHSESIPSQRVLNPQAPQTSLARKIEYPG